MIHPKLKLYNTLTREKQDFVPIDAKNVGLYVCGVTPYDDSHIGHARAYVVFDVLYRLLRHIYGENHVKYVRNFTDIADEIIKRAAERGEEPTALAEHHIKSFHADVDALNVLRPNVEPRVSTHIAGMVEMTDELIEKGYAYVAPSGDVIYRTAKFPRFGELARRKLDEQQHGSRVKADDEKENPNDFILWKANTKSATKLDQAFDPKDYGAKHFDALGRPGWHIECSVMSKQHLGPTFDIHGGGEDLQFPHHCCEIAQSEALLPAGQQMARFWLHNGFITVGGTKMSKSLGNFTTIKNALEKYSPEAIRLWLLQTHYRKPVDYSDEALQAAERSLKNLGNVYEAVLNSPYLPKPDQDVMADFLSAMEDDLNTSKALSVLFAACKLIDNGAQTITDEAKAQKQKAIYSALLEMSKILGIQFGTPEDGLMRQIEIKSRFFGKSAKEAMRGELSEVEQELYDARIAARAAKNWAESDRLRDVLKTEHGILVEDGPNGQDWQRS